MNAQATLPGVEAEIHVDRDMWCTPEWVWRLPPEALRLRDHYDLDPCSNEWSTVPATVRVCPPRDGLGFEWGNASLVFLNPPYSDVGPWFARANECAKAGGTVFGVVPHAPNIEAWRRFGPDAAWSLGRVRFVPPPGIPESSPSQEHDLVLWYPGNGGEMAGVAASRLDVHPSCLYSLTRRAG